MHPSVLNFMSNNILLYQFHLQALKQMTRRLSVIAVYLSSNKVGCKNFLVVFSFTFNFLCWKNRPLGDMFWTIGLFGV